MRRFLIPDANNNYTPLLLHRSALVIYVLVIFVFNILIGQMNFATVYAAVDASTLYSLHNSNRAANGIGGLTVNSQLVTSATNKAQAMLASNCWDHYCPPGTSPWSFILNAGYEYIYAGENLGEGFTNSNTLMNAWMNSPSHRANVLNGNFTEIGIGFAHGSFQGNPNNTIVVVHFGSKQNSAPNPPAKPPTEVKTNTGPAPTAKPVATKVPQAQPSPTTVPNVVIDSPEEGSILNTAEPEISGQKPDQSNLEVYINEEKVGNVDNKGENFSFRPGKLEDGAKKLKAIGFINNRQVTQSEEINFTIDTVPPEVDRENLEISYSDDNNDDSITIRIKTNEDSAKLFTNISEEEFVKNEENVWSLKVNRDQISEGMVVAITAQDLAGNQTILEIPASEILGYFDHDLYLSREDNIIRTNISGPLLGGLFANGIRSRVNFVFIFFLLILFSLDFYFINKSGLTGIRKSKSHLQISAIVILFMVMLVGGFTGSIL